MAYRDVRRYLAATYHSCGLARCRAEEGVEYRGRPNLFGALADFRE